jgi:putative peptidoglycan lipid II flippase
VRQGLIISVVVATQLTATIVTQLVIVRIVGVGPDTDAYFAAQAVPSVLSAIIISALQSVWLPRMSLLANNISAWRVEQAGAQGQAFVMGAVVLSLVWLGSVWWQPILFTGLSAQQLQSVYLFAGPLFIAAALNTQSALLTIALRARDRFLVAEVIAMVGTVISLAAIAIALPRWGLVIVPWIAAGRAFVVYIIQLGLAGWPKIGVQAGLADKKTWGLMRPLLMGASIYKTSPLVDRFWASQAPAGGITTLSLAQSAMGALATIIERSICMPIMPSLSRFVAAGDFNGLRLAYRKGVKHVSFVIIILFAGLVAIYPVFEPLTQYLLNLTQESAFKLWLLCMLLIGFTYVSASGIIIAAAFYALGDTSTPPKIGIATFPIGILIKSIGFFAMGIEGLAAGITATYFLMMFSMIFFLEKRINEHVKIKLKEN